MQDLIERLQSATGPVRELDGLIYGYLNGLKRNDCTFILEIDGERFQFEHPTERHPVGPAALYVRGYKVPEYTASLDAAVKLVPDDMPWDIGGNTACPYATVWNADKTCPHERYQVLADTPALALCIAALRARAS
jgi:hypothetical protein